MPDEPTVTVRGEAAVRAEPDEAVLWVTLTALKESPGEALADVSERSRALVALLDDLGVAPPDRSTTGVTVGEEYDHTSRGRRSLGHRALSQTAVRLTDHETIGRLISRATDELAARIDGPRWQIAADNPVRLQAARDAAADGRRRAQAFAEGVGARLGRLVRLSEPGDGPPGGVWMAAGAKRAMAAEPMPVEPGEHEVAASVEVTFALELD
jgi:uncharacterized protein